ncbi:MAG: hypothetical protein ABI330_04395 [Caldimonas sp.]
MRSVLVYCLVIIFAPSLCNAQLAQLPGPSDLNIGDTWSWQQADDRTHVKEPTRYLTVVGVQGEKMLSNGAQEFRLSDYYVDGGYPLPGSNRKVVARPWRVWPLEVGKKWTFDMDWIRQDGVTGHTRQDVQVVAFEEVEVPAGKFMAFRIVHKGFYSNSNNASAKQDDTYWYAPDLKVDVKSKRDDRFNVYTRELVSYVHSPSTMAASNGGTPADPAAAVVSDADRTYFNRDRLASTFIGKAVRMRRYADGVTITFSFHKDGSATREREAGRNRSTRGSWDLTESQLCLHLGVDAPCFNFYEDGGVTKAGPRGQDARWEVLHVE